MRSATGVSCYIERIEAEMIGELSTSHTYVFGGDQGVSVDGARVVKADIQASNGIIHVIDTVILPVELELGVDRNIDNLERDNF